ncbi:proliferating cell nuclear antigen (pcna) [archaeon]|nr:proliferating cell nuclear antigen (pcna) [archaeon]
MKLSLAEPKVLVDSVNIISELVTEVKFKVLKDRFEVMAMDPANVVMVIFKLLSSAFTEYKVDEEKELCINLENLKQVLRRVKAGDMLKIEEEENKLKITLVGENMRTFSLGLIELDEGDQKVPSLEFPIKIEMPSFVFNEGIEDVGIVAESVALICKDGKFIIESEGGTSAARVEIGDEEGVKVTGGDEVLAKYSIEYLKKISKSNKVSGNVVLEFNKDYPLKISYNVVDRLSMIFILAPRIATE